MMAEVQKMRGEKIYECDFNITGVTDYGVTLDALLSGKEKVPLQGARIDVAFEGEIKGRITGKVRNPMSRATASTRFVASVALRKPRLPRLRIKTFRNIAATERSASRLRPTTGDSIAATDIPIRTRVLPVGLAWLIGLSITAEPTRSPPLLAADSNSS